MSTGDMESEIKNYILCRYELCYNRRIPIEVVGNQYLCKLFLAQDYRPIIIQGEFESDELFLQYIYKELDTRRLHTVWFSKLEKQLDSIYGEASQENLKT